MKTIYKYSLLLAATFFILSGCGELSGTDSDTDPEPSEETVTLMLKSAGTYSDESRTSVNPDGLVFWNSGDVVYINGEPYEVLPDENDPLYATVEGVRASDEYFASYPEPLYETGDGYYEVMIPEYQSYAIQEDNNGVSYGIHANPMIAYGTSDNLQFYNVGAVLCLGIYGHATVTGISVTSNDGSPIAGQLLVPADEVVNGLYSDSYMLASDTGSKRLYLDCLTELSTENETLFHIVLAPESYSKGITVYVRDDSGNVSIQSTSEAQNMFRNTLNIKEPFDFAMVSSPEILLGAATESRIEYEIHALPGAYLKTAVILRSDYETAVESGFETFAYEIFGKIDAVQAGLEGVSGFTASEAYNIDMQTVSLEPDTEYVIVSAYSDSVDTFRFSMSETAARTESSVDPEPSQGGVSTEDFTIGEELQWQ